MFPHVAATSCLIKNVTEGAPIRESNFDSRAGCLTNPVTDKSILKCFAATRHLLAATATHQRESKDFVAKLHTEIQGFRQGSRLVDDLTFFVFRY